MSDRGVSPASLLPDCSTLRSGGDDDDGNDEASMSAIVCTTDAIREEYSAVSRQYRNSAQGSMLRMHCLRVAMGSAQWHSVPNHDHSYPLGEGRRAATSLAAVLPAPAACAIEMQIRAPHCDKHKNEHRECIPGFLLFFYTSSYSCEQILFAL